MQVSNAASISACPPLTEGRHMDIWACGYIKTDRDNQKTIDRQSPRQIHRVRRELQTDIVLLCFTVRT